MYCNRTLIFSLSSFIKKALCLLFLPICLAAQNSDSVFLQLGEAIEREISGGQKHLYRIKVPVKQFVKIKVEQKGVDIAATLLDSSGKLLTQYNADPRNKGVEEVVMTSSSEYEYQISISPSQKTLPKGSYLIHFKESRIATEKEIAINEARMLLLRAVKEWRSGNYNDSLETTDKIIAIWNKYPNEKHPDFHRVYNHLGILYRFKGDFEKAEFYYSKSIELNEKAFGKNHISKTNILNNLGLLYHDKGNYPKAEELHKKTLEIRQNELEPNHLLIALSFNNLGNASLRRGDKEKALIYFQKALDIREKNLGPNHEYVASTLINLANLYTDLDKAESLLIRALAIEEKLYGSEDTRVAQSIYNLCVIYSKKGEYEEAKSFCQRSLEIVENRMGIGHPWTSPVINQIATINRLTGKYDEAEKFYKRAITIEQNTKGKYHPNLGSMFTNLASMYSEKGEFDKAVESQEVANNILEYNIKLNLLIGSERDKLNYLKTLARFENQTLSLNFRVEKKSQAATNLAINTIFQRKGRVLDSMSEVFNSLRQRFNEDDQQLLENLNHTTKQLVDLILVGRRKLKANEYQQKIDKLSRQRENLENQISLRSSEFHSQTKSFDLQAIRKNLPQNSALLEFSIYYHTQSETFDLAGEKKTKKAKEPRYVVYIVTSDNEVQGVELGTVKNIDKAIVAYREALANPKHKDTKELGKALGEKVFEPLRFALGNKAHLLISPDGLLNLIPFEALVNKKERYLIELFSISYLTSGRDLMRMQVARESKAPPILVASPTFGNAKLNSTSSTEKTKDLQKSVTATRNLSDTYFAPLDGTKREALAIKRLFPKAQFLTEVNATETALKKIKAPQMLHIATHGFFLEDIKDEIKNPLLRSGLAFAGANQRKSGNDDGILTALEASGLNLWGTKLVVLSACDTGLGEVKNGEGVYGLRRAFTIAGTESLIMSLWAVSDYVTRELMTDYYKNLKAGMGRNEALRQVQLEMLKKKNRQHPFYWAGFIQSGEWANLEGTR